RRRRRRRHSRCQRAHRYMCRSSGGSRCCSTRLGRRRRSNNNSSQRRRARWLQCWYPRRHCRRCPGACHPRSAGAAPWPSDTPLPRDGATASPPGGSKTKTIAQSCAMRSFASAAILC
ncbi:unnamed protein product, partial [Phaeothamnion confervicola]